MKFEISIEDKHCSEMGELLSMCYGKGKFLPDTVVDDFDTRSQFIVVRLQEKLVAYGRLTPGPDSVFYSWTRATAELPNSSVSIDLGRCMVNPEYRGYDLLRVICLLGFLIAKEDGFHFINGASVPGRGLILLLEEIGYSQIGSQVTLFDPLGMQVVLQFFTCNLKECIIDHAQMLIDKVTALEREGILLEIPDDLLSLFKA